MQFLTGDNVRWLREIPKVVPEPVVADTDLRAVVGVHKALDKDNRASNFDRLLLDSVSDDLLAGSNRAVDALPRRSLM